MPGRVTLVGAGPGDPGLITVKGLAAIRGADAIVYDRLAHPALLKEARVGCELFFAGKAEGRHAMEQDGINALLHSLALKHGSVVRLKGGDPFVFGRGSEEIAYLRERGIDAETVPGVTSAIAAAESAGIPVTHRGVADSFSVENGHSPSSSGRTRVFLMGLSRIEGLAAELIAQGVSPDVPAAAIASGATDGARCVRGTVGTIAGLVRAARLEPPATLVVGETVSIRPQRILVTKVGGEPSRTAGVLRSAGWLADEIQLGEARPLDLGIDLGEWTHVIALSRHSRKMAAGHRNVVTGLAADVAARLEKEATTESRVLYLKSDVAPDRFAHLAGKCVYRAIVAYENRPFAGAAPRPDADYDAVFFTSASCVERFFSLGRRVAGVAYAAGEETAKALERRGVASLRPPVSPARAANRPPRTP